MGRATYVPRPRLAARRRCDGGGEYCEKALDCCDTYPANSAFETANSAFKTAAKSAVARFSASAAATRSSSGATAAGFAASARSPTEAAGTRRSCDGGAPRV